MDSNERSSDLTIMSFMSLSPFQWTSGENSQRPGKKSSWQKQIGHLRSLGVKEGNQLLYLK